MNVLQIGCGKMGGAMLARWLDHHLGQFVIVDPSVTSVPQGATLLRDPSDLVGGRFDMIVCAIKPQMFEQVLPHYQAVIERSDCFLSIAAGCSMERISHIIGNRPVVRAMPNLPALIGEGVTGLLANDQCTQTHKTNAERLAAAVGSTYWLESEDEIDRLTAIAGSGPGYVFEIVRSYIGAARELGFDESMARDLVLQTLIGTAKMAMDTSEPVDALRNSVTSKNGTTEAGLKKLMQDSAMSNLMQSATEAAYERARELR